MHPGRNSYPGYPEGYGGLESATLYLHCTGMYRVPGILRTTAQIQRYPICTRGTLCRRTSVPRVPGYSGDRVPGYPG
eukprot:1539558-Rhodomonas_salina.1